MRFGCRIFALQGETAPGWRLIAAGAGFPPAGAKTALAASSTSSLAFTEELLWSPAAARQWPARRAGAGSASRPSLRHQCRNQLRNQTQPPGTQPEPTWNLARQRPSPVGLMIAAVPATRVPPTGKPPP